MQLKEPHLCGVVQFIANTIFPSFQCFILYIYILVERGSDGLRVTYWYHRQFVESAKERYCKDEETVKLMHATVAEYFIGTWSDGILGCFYRFVF